MNVVLKRCALCKKSGIDRLYFKDRSREYWSNEEKVRKIALSQHESDVLETDDPLGHIPFVLSCGYH